MVQNGLDNSVLGYESPEHNVNSVTVQSSKRKYTRKDCNVILTSAIPDKKFVRATYTLPIFFSQPVDNKLKKKEALTFVDYSSIARELGKSSQQHSTTSDSINIRYVVGKLVSKYPHVLGEVEESRVDFENLLCQIISTYLGRKRREMGIKKSTKGGCLTLDKNEKISDGRARRTTVDNTELDLVSYKANVEKMLELFANSNGVISQALITLWKETYAGRRKQIEDGVLSTVVQDIVKDVCPLLQFQPFLNDEFEGILGSFTKFRRIGRSLLNLP